MSIKIMSIYVTNKLDKDVFIIDLPNVPILRAGKTYDLLKYATRKEIENSKKLAYLVGKGWLKRQDQFSKEVHELVNDIYEKDKENEEEYEYEDCVTLKEFEDFKKEINEKMDNIKTQNLQFNAKMYKELEKKIDELNCNKKQLEINSSQINIKEMQKQMTEKKQEYSNLLNEVEKKKEEIDQIYDLIRGYI